MAKKPKDSASSRKLARYAEHLEEVAYNVGALFMNFGGFEHSLSLAIASALRLTPRQERTLVRGMMARAKVELLEGHAKAFWDKAAHAKLLALGKRARALIEYRNDLAHGFTAPDDKGFMHLVTFRGKHRIEGKASPILLEELERNVAEAETLAHALDSMVRALEKSRNGNDEGQ